eukprot:5054177-Ditylum_brightwellii.AAC.1
MTAMIINSRTLFATLTLLASLQQPRSSASKDRGGINVLAVDTRDGNNIRGGGVLKHSTAIFPSEGINMEVVDNSDFDSTKAAILYKVTNDVDEISSKLQLFLDYTENGPG